MSDRKPQSSPGKDQDPPGGPDSPIDGAAGADEGKDTAERPDPTRYGDWEKDGRCIDF